ncbi:replication initiation and membrane attachment protein DnaB [Peribacillus deserti]|uniref:Replication initiation and membrane attachment protein DnaB n=1 Tax=Peribacillus deserti TaxID=673318 RepID=A0ABS2QNN7_9BACI|nr:hypothetical protein [Peribacillus deserti]MBM7694103.1 replication initiation and membrane attachment protein DnaB [Peribacillus deserti]
MMKDLNDPTFVKYCHTTTPMEMLQELTSGNIRGLDKLALRTLSQRKQLPLAVVNVLLVYFFSTYGNKVYDRNSLARVYDHWAKNNVLTFSQAKEAASIDIVDILENNK